MSTFHFFTFHKAKEIRSPKTVPRLLTVIRGNAILDLARNLKRASTGDRLGAFFFCGFDPFLVSYSGMAAAMISWLLDSSREVHAVAPQRILRIPA